MANAAVWNLGTELHEWKVKKDLILTVACIPQLSARTRGMEVVRVGSKACVEVLNGLGMTVFHAEIFILMELFPDIQVILPQKTAWP